MGFFIILAKPVEKALSPNPAENHTISHEDPEPLISISQKKETSKNDGI
jgi:hypothetical protein